MLPKKMISVSLKSKLSAKVMQAWNWWNLNWGEKRGGRRFCGKASVRSLISTYLLPGSMWLPLIICPSVPTTLPRIAASVASFSQFPRLYSYHCGSDLRQSFMWTAALMAYQRLKWRGKFLLHKNVTISDNPDSHSWLPEIKFSSLNTILFNLCEWCHVQKQPATQFNSPLHFAQCGEWVPQSAPGRSSRHCPTSPLY